MKRLIIGFMLLFAACDPPSTPVATGGQTNWLRLCSASSECGDLECLCGVCTTTCDSDLACLGLPGAECVAPTEDGPSCAQATMCLPRPSEPMRPAPIDPMPPSASMPVGPRVVVDTSVRYQRLDGLGASLAYADDVIVAHPDKETLYDLLFAKSGLDVIRVRNRFDDGTPEPLEPAREIVAAAADRLGHAPLVLMTSGTPPSALKANGSRTCAGDLETCTLRTLPSGELDYAGFAQYWRQSLEAYAAVGITPDYVSIQNNPNWIPDAERPHDACRFLPEEGVTSVQLDGVPSDVRYPGYREALMAVREALADTSIRSRLIGPEATSPGAIAAYVPSLSADMVDALALHFYGVDATSIDFTALESVRAAAAALDRPVFQTEMQADGPSTAVLIHHAFTAGGASAYVQNDLVSFAASGAPLSLVLLAAEGIEPQGPYYALSHFAKRTDPGWVRVDARSNVQGLLSSAWLDPEGDALTIVLINQEGTEVDAEVDVDTAFSRSELTRTVFEGSERAAAIGALSADGVVHMPASSIVTIAFTRDP